MNKSILILVLLLKAFSASAGTFEGKVIKVTDGDTVHVMINDHTKEKIRLAGIDAPEKKQAHGRKATRYLSSLISQKIVTVEFSKRDRYGRIVGKILFNGSDANLLMIKAGYAWHYKEYQSEQSKNDRLIYALAEDNARSQRAGLFQDKAPLEPWQWRKNKKNLREVKSANVTNSNVLVWVNLSSRKYHCPDTRYYGNTKLGKMLPESEAVKSGFSGAHGLVCN